MNRISVISAFVGLAFSASIYAEQAADSALHQSERVREEQTLKTGQDPVAEGERTQTMQRTREQSERLDGSAQSRGEVRGDSVAAQQREQARERDRLHNRDAGEDGPYGDAVRSHQEQQVRESRQTRAPSTSGTQMNRAMRGQTQSPRQRPMSR